MKNRLLFIAILMLSFTAFGQREASNWLFGNNKGIRFLEDGSVQMIDNSAMQTDEGCSAISDAAGNLLFYTDGRTVWDRNHLVMPNANYNGGSGLLGDPSSTQSAIIVPKPASQGIYYIFTVDEPHHSNAAVYPATFTGTYPDTGQSTPMADDGKNNGLNYAVVDLSVTGSNGSIGDIVGTTSHLVTYDPANSDQIKFRCSEKVTAVAKSDGTGFWVITHFIDRFYAFEVSAVGVNPIPVVSVIGPVVPLSGYRRNAIGSIKASPDGSRIAIGHSQRSTAIGIDNSGGAYLYDFSSATGTVSNQFIIRENRTPYGLEFSPKGTKLYISYDYLALVQYDLTAPDIIASEIGLAPAGSSSGALQLGPDGKIYNARTFSNAIHVINNPEEPGSLCNFQMFGLPLPGAGYSMVGLPQFITSYFAAGIRAAPLCAGHPTQFSIGSAFDTVSWNFGDGSAASQEPGPLHTYAVAGTYNVTATITIAGNSRQVSQDIAIGTIPIANPVPDNILCGQNTAGTAEFNLSLNATALLGAQDPSQFDITYYTTEQDAIGKTNPLNAAAYTNTSNPQNVFARIEGQGGCFATRSFKLSVILSPVIINSTFSRCDDAADGDDANGKASFDLSSISSGIVSDNAQYTIAFYPTQADAQGQTNSLSGQFPNTAAGQQVLYARIAANAASGCITIAPITLIVNPLPTAVSNVTLTKCDFGLPSDGFASFNLPDADPFYSVAMGNLSVFYYLSAADAATAQNALPDAYTNIANPQSLYARVINQQTGCYRIMGLTLEVKTDAPDAITLTACESSPNTGLAQFDLADSGLGNTAGSVAYFASQEDASNQSGPLASPYTNAVAWQQRIYARIDDGVACARLQEIILEVLAAPSVEQEVVITLCVGNNEQVSIDAGSQSSDYTYSWSTGATTFSIMVGQPGIYTVSVTSGIGCSTLRSVTVTPSSAAVIDAVDIRESPAGNRITVHVLPQDAGGDYRYSIDKPQGPYQVSPQFENVAPGMHTVYVYNINGCGITSEMIAVLGIPTFFTPNGDSINDTWRITGINPLSHSNAEIYIFDRYGRLLASVDPKGMGWDGRFNGVPLPATDYWYSILLDGRDIRGHFSLMR